MLQNKSCKCRIKHLIELQEHLERYCNVLRVFGFNSAKYDINLIKSYLLRILITERRMEPTVNKRANNLCLLKSVMFSF